MKKLILPAIIILFGLSALPAQTVKIEEKKVLTDDVPVDALVMAIGKEHTFSKKTFKKYVKDNLDVKINKEKKLALIAQKVSAPSISLKRGDLRATYFTEGDSAYIGVSFILGYDIFINSNDYPGEMKSLKEFVRGYQEYHFTSFYNDLIEKQEKRKKELDKELKKNERTISNLRKLIASNEKKVIKTDDDAKKLELKNKNARHNAEISTLSAAIPDLKEAIIKVETEIAELKNSQNTMLLKIKEAQRWDLISQHEGN